MRRAITLGTGAAAVALAAAVPAPAQAPHGQDQAATAPTAQLLGAPPPVAMADKIFAPDAVTALVGDPATWVDDDRVAHDVATLDGAYDSGRIEPGARTQHVFTAQGDIQYRCKLHRFMFGRVRVLGLALAAAGSSATPGARAKLDGRAAPGTGDVSIEQRGPDGAFTAVGVAHPGADGTFGTEVAPRAPSTFRARAGELTSAEVRVVVAPKVTIRTQRHGRHIMLTVRATPAQAGAPVALQRYRRERFGLPHGGQGRARPRLVDDVRAALELLGALPHRARAGRPGLRVGDEPAGGGDGELRGQLDERERPRARRDRLGAVAVRTQQRRDLRHAGVEPLAALRCQRVVRMPKARRRSSTSRSAAGRALKAAFRKSVTHHEATGLAIDDPPMREARRVQHQR